MHDLYEVMLPVFTSFLAKVRKEKLLSITREYIEAIRNRIKTVLYFDKKNDNLFGDVLLTVLLQEMRKIPSDDTTGKKVHAILSPLKSKVTEKNYSRLVFG